MIKTFAQLMVAVASSIPLAAHAVCEQPNAISVPDGATSTFEQLLAAQSTVTAYMAAMESYLACVNEELAVGGDDAPTEFKTALATTHSSAVTEIEALAAAFNRELQEFRSAHPELRTDPRVQRLFPPQ